MPEQTPVYVISVAARLLDVHPQTLRNYERAGFLQPTRTEGKRRLYSIDDIERLRHLIGTVEQYGLNLSGLKMLLALRHELLVLHHDLEGNLTAEETRQLRARIAHLLIPLSGAVPADRAEPLRSDE